LFDLDGFKQINDQHGHQTGDQVLQRFGTVAQTHLPPGSALGRIGGEEFAAVFVNPRVEAAVDMAEQIRTKFADFARIVEGRRVNATVSVGVAEWPEHGADLEQLLRAADSSLYEAKAAGRNTTAHAGRLDRQRFRILCR
jgi:diguanylate cyclase (GGDEF)-like protein